MLGTRIKRIIERDIGINPCDSCNAMIERLNEYSVERMSFEKGSIARRIMANAMSTHHWWLKFAVFVDKILDSGATERMVLRIIDEAIEGELLDAGRSDPSV